MLRWKTHPSVIALRVGALVAVGISSTMAIDYYGRMQTFCVPGGGCDVVRQSELGQQIAFYLPALGMLAYTVLFTASLFTARATLRWTGILALLGAVGGLVLVVLQGAVIHTYCGLCVGVDAAAIFAGLAGAWILRAKPGDDDDAATSLASPWWGVFVLAAFGPLVYAATAPDSEVPAALRELRDPDADVNIIELVDFQCPYCRALDPVLRSVIEESEADIRVTRVMVPMTSHSRARSAAAGYLCAERQGRGDEMAARLFEAPDISTGGTIVEARELELDQEAFRACLGDLAIQVRINEDLARVADPRTGQLPPLPTVIIGDRVFVGFNPDESADHYREAIEATARGEGRRVHYWPGALLLLGVLLAVFLGMRRPPLDAS